jgi:molybdenum cofactor synthesis domain-containing protein
MKTTILAVGTELTTGQISNRNGQWISKKLNELGFACASHVVVPDDRKLILEALAWAETQADVIFVTGGLGPTSDDFTRELVSEWCKSPLEFHQASWKHVQSQLQLRGLQPKDMHRQECYFPKNAKIFQNNVGTANAFSLQTTNKTVFVLPGPPKEIEGLWKDFVHNELASFAKNLDPYRVFSWDCIGLAEADLAEKLEAQLRDCSFEKGYRVHLPYVEFKLSFHQSQISEIQQWETLVSETLEPWLISRNGADVAHELSEKLVRAKEPIWICDEVAKFQLLERLMPVLKNNTQKQKFTFIQSFPANPPQGLGLRLLPGEESTSARAQFYNKGKLNEKIIHAPERFRTWPDRLSMYFAELAIVEWNREI